MTDNGLELAEIWSDQAGATVDGEILAFGIGQYSNTLGPCQLNQRLMIL
mgnify:CR=1 FL=1